MLRLTGIALARSYGRLTCWPTALRKNPPSNNGAIVIPPYVAPTMRFYASASQNYTVEHDTRLSTFYIDANEKGKAFLEYDESNGKITILHTEIPQSLQGLGLGKIIAKEALEYVAKNNLEMKIECDFVAHYVKKYAPKYLQYCKNC